MEKKAKVIAYYLPQYHPIIENDLWWGKGFTEWTNVGKAKKLFKGHYQPRVPKDLGYYDLRLPEVRQEQANMAYKYGIDGFCYWHYWFGNGKRLLEKPFQEVLKSKEPNFPFCLAWANTSWKGFNYGVKGRNVLIEQTYPGDQDYEDHFFAILPALIDKRYLRIENKPIFVIFAPEELPDIKHYINYWQNLAKKNGLDGLHFIAHTTELKLIDYYLEQGFQSVNIIRLSHILKHERSIFTKILQKIFAQPYLHLYKDAIKYFSGKEDLQNNVIPTIFPNWDHSPRTGRKGFILHKSNPELFSKHVKLILDSIEHKQKKEKIVFLKSWNEWGEGNYMEPDLVYGHKYLEVLHNNLFS